MLARHEEHAANASNRPYAHRLWEEAPIRDDFRHDIVALQAASVVVVSVCFFVYETVICKKMSRVIFTRPVLILEVLLHVCES